MEKYYYQHNRKTLIVFSTITFFSCMFWIIFNRMNEDMYELESMNATPIILFTAAASFACLILQLKKGLCDKPVYGNLYRFSLLAFYMLLIMTTALVNIAQDIHGLDVAIPNYAISVPLVSTLLVIPATCPMPKKCDGLLLLTACLIAFALPLHAPGAEHYPVVQESVLRAAIISTYIIVWIKTKQGYEEYKRIEQYNERLQLINEKIVDMFVGIIEVRDVDSGNHVDKVRVYTKILATQIMNDWPQYNLTPAKIEIISKASAVHDIGKIFVPDAILLKPGKLTPEERAIIEAHTTKGCEILEQIPEELMNDEYARYCREITMCHHEKYDGNGYPNRLKGEEIPLCAQIVSITDCYEALTSERPYKKAFSPKKAYEMIKEGQCGSFSENLLESFTHCQFKMEKHFAENNLEN